MSSSAGLDPDAAGWRRGLTRRTLALIVAVEALAAMAVAGIAVRGAFGWGLVVLAALCIPVLLLWRRGYLLSDPRETAAARVASRLRVVGATSRSSGDVGVVGDEQGYAAGLELLVGNGTTLDLGAIIEEIARDPSRPSAVQLRVTSDTPSGARHRSQQGRGAARVLPVHRRVDLVIRFEPARAGDVVERHGGAAKGSRAALVAALDRASMRLRRAGTANRVLDTAAMSALLADDTTAEVPTRLLSLDLTSGADVARLLSLIYATGPRRSVISLCVDLSGGDQWRSHGVVQLADPDPRLLDAAAAMLTPDAAVLGPAPAASIAGVLPLGGGPGDLADVLTLART